jgi:hypothetical protein
MKDADGPQLWYSLVMKRHRKSTGLSEDPITDMAATVAKGMAERTRMIHELLPQLALAVAANERAQRRFRTAVLIRLSRIDTMLQMIHGAQIVEAHRSEPCFDDKINQHTKDAEDYISQHSKELGLKMVKYVYDEPEAPGVRGKARRKRSP